MISHTPYWGGADSAPRGWGATVRELDQLATLSDELVHLATHHSGEVPGAALAHRNPRVRLRLLPPTGGPGWSAKLGIITASPRFFAALEEELAVADAVHVRAPANVALLALWRLRRYRGPLWVKYAGNWRPADRDAWSYRLQRWWLSRPRGFVVSVNGRWEGQPDHVRTFDNPSFDLAELARLRALSSGKTLETPPRLVFAGRVEAAKGIEACLGAWELLRAKSIEAELDVCGDGELLEDLRARYRDRPGIRFHGWLEPQAVHEIFRQGHFLVLPSRTEGWPKVVSEGMAAGLVPVCSEVGSIRQTLAEIGAGRTVPAVSPAEIAAVIRFYLEDPVRWQAESERGAAAADRFTYERYLTRASAALGLR